MTLLELVETLSERPRLVVMNQRFILLDRAVICERRVGKGERWAFSPSHDITPFDRVPRWWPREARQWIARASLDIAAHGRAMGARTL